MADPIPSDDRGAYDPGTCTACGEQLHAVSWRQVNPIEDTWLPLAATCVNAECEQQSQTVELAA